IDCSSPGTVPPDFAECCDPAIPRTIQERAWASPVWYRPDAIGRLKGGVSYGRTPGHDRLVLSLRLAAVPFDVMAVPVTITVEDDDRIFTTTIPAGAMVAPIPRPRFEFPADGAGGRDLATLHIGRRGEGVFTIRTSPPDLTAADRVDHAVLVTLQAGTYASTYARTWVASGARLRPVR